MVTRGTFVNVVFFKFYLLDKHLIFYINRFSALRLTEDCSNDYSA